MNDSAFTVAIATQKTLGGARVARWEIQGVRLLTVAIVALALTAPARASVRDAAITGLSCSACHQAGAQLTEIGSAYRARSNRLEPIGTRPIAALKATASYGSDPLAPSLPRVVSDYLTISLAGKLARHLSYVADQRIVDGGMPGITREAYLFYHVANLRATAGAAGLPFEIDPERFRDLQTTYVAFTQTVGDNPFSLDATHPSIGVYLGDPFRGLELGVIGLAGHEFGSEIPQSGLDSALSLKLRAHGLVVGALSYGGKRNLGLRTDVFHRDTLSATAYRNAWTLEAFLARGKNTGTTSSSAGLAQLRYDFGTRAFVQARYEGRADSLGDFVRQTVIGGGIFFRHHSRITLEDAYRRSPQAHHVFRAVFAVGTTNSPLSAVAY